MRIKLKTSEKENHKLISFIREQLSDCSITHFAASLPYSKSNFYKKLDPKRAGITRTDDLIFLASRVKNYKRRLRAEIAQSEKALAQKVSQTIK